jgi:hypothetical protein
MVGGTTDRHKHDKDERVETQPPKIRRAVPRFHHLKFLTPGDGDSHGNREPQGAGSSKVTAPNLAIVRANYLVATYRLNPHGVAERARFIRREGQ